MSFPIEKVLVDERVWHDDLTRRILSRCPDVKCEVIKADLLKKILDAVLIKKGKRILFLTRSEGDLVKPCPATLPPYLCCRYMVINQTLQCPMDCTYCILQSYLDQSVITVNINLSDIFSGVDALLVREPSRLFRFGTGELGDSLALDGLTGLSVDLIRFFSSKRNAIIELKTKTGFVDTFIDLEPKQTVVSWSLNPQSIVETQEFYSATLSDRLQAARKCQNKGWLLGFHFDPILYLSGWEKSYQELITQIFTGINGSRIAWISLGSLRFPPDLKAVIQKRFPGCRIIYEEMIRGLDGKMRYPRPLRIEMYRKIYTQIKENAPDVFIYFCMESPDVWERVVGFHPESNGDLDFRFAQSLYTRFPELNMNAPKKENYIHQGKDNF